MSTPFYDLASLVVVPSGYKSGKIYAQKPLTTDGQLTFTRASTATRVNASGLIESVASGVPRLDYLGSSCPKLQLEPQRTNDLVRSSEFDNASWLKEDLTVTANAAVAPDGTTSADLMVPNTTTIDHSIYQTVSTGAAQSFSVFAKAGGYNYVFLGSNNAIASNGVFFNLSNGTISQNTSSLTASIVSYGNGWYRCSVTSSSWPTIYAIICTSANGISFSHAGNGTSGVYVWGAQFEAGAYATSYIPTTSAAVTRVVETAEKTGISSLIGQPAGSFYFEYVPNKASASTAEDYIPFAISDGTSGQCLFFNDYNGNLNFYIQSSGTQTAITFPDLVAGNTYKIAVGYNTNDVALYINGVLIGTDSVATMPTTMSKLQFNGFTSPVHVGSINVKQTLLFKTRLTNAQLAELTTL